MSSTNLSSSNKDSLGGGEVDEYKYANRDAIDKDLVCSICREPFIYPMAVPNCEHIFCKECISHLQDNKCPTCRNPFNQSQVKPAHRFIIKALDSLQVCCTNDGCTWQGNRDQHNVHRKECTFEKIACDFAKFGCDFSGTRGAVETHLNDTCKFKELKLFFKAYLELEKKVQVLEKKVEHLQKGGTTSGPSSGASRPPPPSFPLFIPSSLVSPQPPQTSPEEEAQLLALHQAAMRHTQSRAEQERKEKEKKEKEAKEKAEKEKQERERENPQN